MSRMQKAAQPWREAATLIIAAKAKPKPDQFLKGITKPISALSRKVLEETDYKLLVLKRSGKSKFMPNSYVFPGGLLSTIDYSEKWAKMYSNALGLKEGSKLTTASLGISGVHSKEPAPMYCTNYVSPIPNEAIFRICAIRETFEESGILLCVEEQELEKGRSSGVVHKHISSDKRKLLPDLRKEVNADDSKFLEICRDLKVVPDIWGLVEHSNWLTPTTLKGQAGRRYDTAFFLSFVSGEVDYEQDNREVTDAQWMTPAEILLNFRQGKLKIMPPQVFTLCELLTVTSWTELAAASLRRLQQENIERIFPVRMGFKDGAVSLLKGDFQYPKNPDFDGTQDPISFDVTLEEGRKPDVPLNRFELRGVFQQTFLDTVTDRSKPFSMGQGHSILGTLSTDLDIDTDPTRNSGDISHIG